MAQTIYIGGNIATSTTRVLFSEQDFVDLVEEYMGRDARSYLESIIRQRDEAKRDGFDAGLSAASEYAHHSRKR